MSTSLHTAEQLALTAESQEDASQALCANIYNNMKWAIGIPTSPSPPVPAANNREAAGTIIFSQKLENPLTASAEENESQALETPLIRDRQHTDKDYIFGGTTTSHPLLQQPFTFNKSKFPPGWRLGFDANKNPRLYDQNGNIVHQLPKKMSSHSSGSTTQENPRSWYDLHDSFGVPAGEPASQASQPAEDEPSTSASAGTQSFHDDETGHIDFLTGFGQEECEKEYSQDQSQAAEDAEEAVTQIANPETPALTRPSTFVQSFPHHTAQLLGASQLFQATQISPLIQAPASAASERPSPDVYSADNITSPIKTAPLSSPSTRGSFVSRANPSHRRQLTTKYISRKEAEEKERRAMAEESSDESQSSDGFDSASQRRHRRAQHIRNQAIESLGLVSIPAGRFSGGFKNKSDEIVPKKKPISNQKPVQYKHRAPAKKSEPIVPEEDVETEDEEEGIFAPLADIAIPGSTETPAANFDRRLHGSAEEYIAQTNNTIARDTQEDEMVIDSQVLPTHHDSSSAARDELPELDNDYDMENEPGQQSTSSNSARSFDPLSERNANAPRIPKSNDSSPPLQEGEDIVLETSPYRIRAFKDLGDESSPVDGSQPMLDGIGFTQDEEDRLIMSQSSLPQPRPQRVPPDLTSRHQVVTNSSEADIAQLAPQSFPTSSLRQPASSVQPVLEVGGTPKSAPPVAIPTVSTGLTVLDTPQASNHVQSKTMSDPAVAVTEPSTAVDPDTDSSVKDRSVNPETLSSEGRSGIARKRENKDPYIRPSKKPKFSDALSNTSSAEPNLQVGMTAEENSGLQSTLATNTGLKYYTAPEATSSANYLSVQSSALSDISDSVNPITPEAFKDIGQKVDAASIENTTGDSAIASTGPVESPKRKRAIAIPSSSSTPTETRSAAPSKVKKAVGRPSKVSQGIVTATPKAVKALRGVPASGTRSSARQAAATNAAAIVAPSSSLSRDSTSRTRSTSRLSAAPSIAGNNSLPSTPSREKGKSTTKRPSKSTTSHGLFRTMAFAVSYVRHPKQKEDILAKIYEEDGFSIDPGFEELFTVDDLPVTPSRSNRAAAKLHVHGLRYLEKTKPNERAREITFACVIADTYSRKAKYMQALSLDLPCLHGAWILKCVADRRIVDWTPYLLSAGAPDLFDGAARSRALTPYPAQSANFSQHFDSNDRPKLLRGKSVLIIVGTTKAAIELRKAYVFIIHALGAEKAGTVPTIEDARNLLATEAGQEWDWLYVHTNEELGIRALAFFEEPDKKKRFRRKADRDEAYRKYEEEAAELDKLRVKVIGDYFIVQSLILGMILDEGCDRAYNDPVIEEETDDDEEATDDTEVPDQEEQEDGEAEQGSEDEDEEDEDEEDELS